jgi:hypothetical protein
MEEKTLTTRKYNSNSRRKILDKIKTIKSNEELVDIFKIVNRDIGNDYSENNSGIYFNMNLLSDDAINEILELLQVNTISETAIEPTDDKLIYKTYSENNIEGYNSIGPRLSNQEKSILKQSKNIN